MKNEPEKLAWSGTIVSIQPRTTVWRYRLDNRTHSHIGYNLFLDGEVNGLVGSFSVAISEKQQQKTQFHIGDKVMGTAWTKMYAVTEYADYYRAGALKVVERAVEPQDACSPPPYLSPLPDMATCERRGARMLSASCYKGKCFQCVWATMAAVAIEYDWGVRQKHRFESFCYGPKSCKFYKMGRPRAVPYKGDGSSFDDGCLDEILTEGRSWDE